MTRLLALLALAACANERELAPCIDCETSGVHPTGFIELHGAELASRNWDFALCQSCHGESFAGTNDAPSCRVGCHEAGPTACDTCHDTVPATGAHLPHVAVGLTCSECHVTPATWDAPGHILDDSSDGADVLFGSLANRDLTPSRRTAPAAWDRAAGTCSNVYCHGGILGDTSATHATPNWAGGAEQVACGSCHGVPPAGHAQSECSTCHVNAGYSTARHINGVVDVGSEPGCSGCHGGAASAAPPRGLNGETATSSLAVGAHTAHLVAGQLRGPIACEECHAVPATIDAAGHIDTALPADLVFGTLARADGAQPVWNRTTGTCSSVYCHGGGTSLAAETAANKQPTPLWTANTATSVYCGACHGLPPVDAFHSPTQTLTDCATCHPGSVGPFGNILVSNGLHLNGSVEVTP
jgi:predicted CxxxxCH...CXXCH cytochrome family protein